MGQEPDQSLVLVDRRGNRPWEGPEDSLAILLPPLCHPAGVCTQTTKMFLLESCGLLCSGVAEPIVHFGRGHTIILKTSRLLLSQDIQLLAWHGATMVGVGANCKADSCTGLLGFLQEWRHQLEPR